MSIVPSVVLTCIHNWQQYVVDCIKQILTFNPAVKIYLVTEQEFKEHLNEIIDKIEFIDRKSLVPSELHKQFQKSNSIDSKFRNGFWLYTTERLFYLHELIAQKNLKHVVHLENDNLIYVDLIDFIPKVEKLYKNLAIPYISDEYGILSFIYIRDASSIGNFIAFLTENKNNVKNDMLLCGMYMKEKTKNDVDCYPVIMPEYQEKRDFDIKPYSKFIDELGGYVIDANAVGMYLDGHYSHFGKRTKGHRPGYVCLTCKVYNCKDLNIEFKKDNKGRKYPTMTYKNRTVKLTNLHIHSKYLYKFASY